MGSTGKARKDRNYIASKGNGSINTMGTIDVDMEVRSTRGSASNKRSRERNLVVRRSPRIRNIQLDDGVLEEEKEEALNITKSSTPPVVKEKGLEQEKIERVTVPNTYERELMQKVDYLVEAVDFFKSQNFEQDGRKTKDGPSSNPNYKSFYFNAQKKIEALMEANYDLSKKLEFANGKVAAKKVMHCMRILCEVTEKELGREAAGGACPSCSGKVVAVYVERRWWLCFITLAFVVRRRYICSSCSKKLVDMY